MKHELKIAPDPFIAVMKGKKKAEFRLNDRGFQTGDTLNLKEWDRDKYTGRELFAAVTHIQTGFGIPEGYMMLSIKVQK